MENAAVWEVVKKDQGIWHRLPKLEAFEREADAEEFARRFAACNPNAPITVDVRKIADA